MRKLTIGNLVFRLASDVKSVILRATEARERNDKKLMSPTLFYYICGLYESRIFGVVISRAHSCEFIDNITDRFLANIK